jgi:multidrug efflux system membrane fusion protein
MKTRRIAAAAGLLAALVSSACQTEEAYQKPLTPVSVRTVTSYSGGEVVRYSGNIEPYQQVAVAFKVGGYVEEIRQVRGVGGAMRSLQGGDEVTRTEPLARLREADYSVKVAQARAQLSQAEASAAQAVLDFDRANALFAAESLTKPSFDAARARLDAARAAVESARAVLEEAELALRDCTLRAPLDGVVLERAIEPGSLVGAGTLAFVIADVSSVKVVFGVPDVRLGKLNLGDSLEITTEAFREKSFRGRISRIAPAADPKSRVFDVELQVPNPRGELKPGMIAALGLAEERLPGSFPAVPLRAIVRSPDDSESFSVVVVEQEGGESVAHYRRVRIGRAFGNTITLAEGVRPGEQVVVSGAAIVAEGEKVRVIPEVQ